MSQIVDLTLSLQLGDVNEDGRLDLVVSNAMPEIYLYLNQGGDTPFRESIDLGPSQSGGPVLLSDFDNDGRPDLVLGQIGGPFDEHPLMLFRNLGRSPWFANTQFLQEPAIGSGRLVLAAGDVDGDGDRDLLSAHGYNTGGVWDAQDQILLHRNSGAFPVFDNPSSERIHFENTFSQDVRNLFLADLTGDGHDEILLVRGSPEGVFPNGCLLLPVGQGGAIGQASYLFTEPGNFSAGALGDLDRDGDLDVVLASHTSPSSSEHHIFVYLNQNQGASWLSFKIHSTSEAIVNSLHLADLNGDQLLDLVLGGFGLGRILLGGTSEIPFADAIQIPFVETPDPIQSMAVGDVDGDGKPDLILGLWDAANKLILNRELPF